MKYLLSLLVIFVISDGLLTNFLVNGGLAREANPFLQNLVGGAGFIVIKAVGVLLCAFILWDIYKRLPRVALVSTWFFVISYGVIVLWNSAVIIIT